MKSYDTLFFLDEEHDECGCVFILETGVLRMQCTTAGEEWVGKEVALSKYSTARDAGSNR